MKRVYVLCEGQTEESAIKGVLYSYFLAYNIHLIPIIVETKRTLDMKHKGGIGKFSKLIKEARSLCCEHVNETVTFFVDFYGLPDDAPVIDPTLINTYDKVSYLEEEVAKLVDCRNFIPYFNVHEFEALLFSDVSKFECITSDSVVRELENIVESYASPEFINNSILTAPSKRILSLIPEYRKIIDGTRVLSEVGVENVLSKCNHFSEWICQLKGVTEV